jgi:hypothetical protein
MIETQKKITAISKKWEVTIPGILVFEKGIQGKSPDFMAFLKPCLEKCPFYQPVDEEKARLRQKEIFTFPQIVQLTLRFFEKSRVLQM